MMAFLLSHCRYVALREILMYHVGYESFNDPATGVTSYAIRENLIMNYSQHSNAGAAIDATSSSGSSSGSVVMGESALSLYCMN